MCDRLVVTLPLVLCVLQHYKQPELYATILHYMNTTFTGLFSIECMMKIHAYGFRVSTQGKLQMQVAFDRPRVAILRSIQIFYFFHEPAIQAPCFKIMTARQGITNCGHHYHRCPY